MKTDLNNPTAPRSDSGHWGGLFRVAIIGAATLKGRELKEVLSDRNFPANDIRLLDDEESLGQLQAIGEEPTFIQSVLPEHLENVDFTFFTTEEGYTRDHWELARKAGSDIIDLSYGLEDRPDIQLRAPWVERELGVERKVDFIEAPVVLAHPASVVLALLLLRARKVGNIVRAIATLFEPASEHGRRGMDELHEQTVNLLSFQQLPKGVFDTQVAFNLLDRFGEKAVPTLASVESRIVRHFHGIVQDKLNVPSLMLLQAPIFHGHAFSLYIELDNAGQIEEMVAAISGDHVDVLQGGEESPSNVNAAGQEQIQVFARQDPQRPNCFWLWAASDNLRISALGAVECAEGMIASRPRGKVQ